MKIQRGDLAEKDGTFTCTVTVPLQSLGQFLGLLPVSGRWIEVGVDGEPAPAPLLPTPAPAQSEAPAPSLPIPAPEPAKASAESRAPAQIVAPAGSDFTRHGGGRTLPREVMVMLVACRDPVYQDWTIKQSGADYAAVPDALQHAAEWTAKQVGAADLFTLTPEQCPKLAELGQRYERYLSDLAAKRAGK